jgi:hypothetical protein
MKVRSLKFRREDGKNVTNKPIAIHNVTRPSSMNIYNRNEAVPHGETQY